ncbi:MAG: DUF1080 domain-containing protein [Candidatus Hydrogenedens sp.]|nr:DUF1080 domain-containing protein [Candidatus Hydrogenedens sp.]
MAMSRFIRHTTAALLTALLLGASSAFAIQEGPEDFFPASLDPFTGEYEGHWEKGEDVDIHAAAYVYALGRDRYHIRFAAKLDMRCPPKFEVEAKAVDGKLEFEERPYSGVIENGVMTGGRGRLATFTLKKVERPIAAMGTPAPEGAVVLFDGSGLDAWTGADGAIITPEGALMVTPDSEYLSSKEKFNDVHLHIEFRLPYKPTASGQARGNSGVFLNKEYEVQVLDSFGLEGYYDECGAIYKVAAPKVNACRPPLQWQAYDIDFHPAEFDADGKVVKNPRMTVWHNDKLVHNDQELWWITGWKDEDRAEPHVPAPESIRLQGHGNYVQYRNIWAKPLN